MGLGSGVRNDHSPWAQGIRGPSPQYSKIWTGIHKINLWKSWNHTEFWGHGKVQWAPAPADTPVRETIAIMKEIMAGMTEMTIMNSVTMVLMMTPM